MLIVKWEELLEVIKMLNETDLIDTELQTRPSKVSIHNFMKAVESIPVEQEEVIPKPVTAFYNMLVTRIEDDGETAVLDVDDTQPAKKKKEKPVKKEKVEKKPVEKKEKKVEEDVAEVLEPKVSPEKKKKEKKAEEKKETVPHPQRSKGEKDQFGTRLSTGAHKINMLFIEGGTLDGIAEEVGTTSLRVRNHIAHLKEKGYEFEITKDSDGKVTYRVIVEEKK